MRGLEACHGKIRVRRNGDAAWKRIQLGMQFGVRARISNKFLIGIGYSMDLTNISKYEVYHTDISSKFHSFDITLGYCF